MGYCIHQIIIKNKYGQYIYMYEKLNRMIITDYKITIRNGKIIMELEQHECNNCKYRESEGIK